MLSIKKYNKHYFPLIKSWWEISGETAPLEANMPEESTFLLYSKDDPIACISVFLTNTSVAWYDNLIGNPDFKGSMRKEGINLLLKYADKYAKEQGKALAFCMSINPKTTRRYKEFGFSTTHENVTTMIKEI